MKMNMMRIEVLSKDYQLWLYISTIEKHIMKNLLYLAILVLVTSCSNNDDADVNAGCLEKDYLESYIAEPNDCFLYEDPAMTFTFVGFDDFTKSEFEEVPYAIVWVRILIDDFSWEFPHTIYDDTDTAGFSFTGNVTGGFNEHLYTIYFDEIEFTETETAFIFHRATLRLEKAEE